MRLDIYLATSGIAASRSEAKALIINGSVSIAGAVVTKPAFNVDGNEKSVAVDTSGKRFVSRGGEKLAGALKSFMINPSGARCLDIGASSGGFTDCLLQNGAEHVIAVDAGEGQLAASLRSDARVSVIENYNARYMRKEDFEYLPSLVVMDVSFISATLIIPSLAQCIAAGGDYILLIKPQFEVGRSHVGKGGIVRDEKSRLAAVERVIDCAVACGFQRCGLIESPIKGGDGNIEYLVHFKKMPNSEN